MNDEHKITLDEPEMARIEAAKSKLTEEQRQEIKNLFINSPGNVALEEVYLLGKRSVLSESRSIIEDCLKWLEAGTPLQISPGSFLHERMKKCAENK